MKYTNRIISGLVFCFLVVFVSCQTSTEDNQEASNQAASTEEKVTIADVERGIRENIKAKTKEGDGYFSFTNDTSEFSLKLVRVHTEYLSVLSSSEFFACVDLATEEGDVYDVDFFLKGSKDDMEVTRTSLHKLNGKPFYTWQQNKEDKTWFTVDVKNASNKLLGVIEGKDEFIFKYEVELPTLAGTGEIWMPVATSDPYQTIEVLTIDFPGEYEIIKDKEYENSILYAKLSPEQSNETILIEYLVKRSEKGPYADPAIDLTRYLQPSELMPVGNRFSVIAEEVIKEKNAETDLMKARVLYDYVIDNVRYAKQGVYGTGDANYACDSKSGNCTEFHSLFISLARSAGIPARFAVGAGIPSSRDEGGVDGYHCWAEFYAEEKWWPVDISEADKYTALATYYFGHHPANRLELSRGRDLVVEINFLAYPVLEVEGEPDFVQTTFTFNRSTENS